MIANGKNILDMLDSLEGKTVKILTIPEEEHYCTGFKAVVENIQKEYFDQGSYNVYVITLDFSEFEKANMKHDIGGYGENGKLKWNQTDFYDGKGEYRICVEFDKHKLNFEEDYETDFFEIL